MERLITVEDLQKYPELSQMGVSLNQHFDLENYEQQLSNSAPPTTPIPPQLAATKEEVVMAKKIAPVKKAPAKSTPVKKELTKKASVKVAPTPVKKIQAVKKATPKKADPKKASKKK